MKKSLKITVFLLLTACVLGAAVLPAVAEDVVAGGTVTEESVGNLFAKLYAAFSDCAGEIFCALSLVGTLILTFLYKKGLFPFLTKTLGTVNAKIGDLRCAAEESAGHTEALIGGLTNVLTATEKRLTDTALSLDALEKTLAANTSATDRQVLITILDEQVTLLADIFASTSLPQYKKDEIGARVADMRKKLAGLGEDGDET